jgi:hypothetical protein
MYRLHKCILPEYAGSDNKGLDLRSEEDSFFDDEDEEDECQQPAWERLGVCSVSSWGTGSSLFMWMHTTPGEAVHTIHGIKTMTVRARAKPSSLPSARDPA